MQVGEIKILLKDAGSKMRIWGKKNSKVTVISISGNAVTVEDERGERFPCNINDLK